MMKKIILFAVFAICTTAQTMAQDVFNQVVNNAKLVLEDPKADPFLTSVSQFKYTALQYLCNTAIKQNGGSVRGDLLDTQAMGLNDFISSYFSELAKCQTDAEKKDTIKKYWKACAANPMFENQNKEITDAFMNDPECIMPFSINTDWEKADQAVSVKK